MMDVVKVISEYMEERKLNVAQVADLCGWKEKRLSAILSGYQKLNAADYGVLCEVLQVPYDSFYKRSKGIYSSCQ